MKKISPLILTALLVAVFAVPVFASDELPLTLAGITLGEDVKKYSDRCDIELGKPMADAPFLSEILLKSDCMPGIRGGSLTYANCNETGKLVRIKLKFHNRGQKLFNSLLDKYTKVYGKPDSYQGDAFKNINAWQWNFAKGDKKVSLLLMWSRVSDMRPGVSIKMTLDSLLEEEFECYKAENAKLNHGRSGPSKIENIDEFVPR